MRTKPFLYLPILLIGFCGLIAQVVVLREMVVTFYGNELSIGVMLGAWLLWTGLGSLGLGRLARRLGQPQLWLAGALVVGAVALLATVAGARGLKIVLGLGGEGMARYYAHPLRTAGELLALLARPSEVLARLADAREVSLGQIRPFGLMLASSLALLGPFCLLNGFLFPLACRAAAAMPGQGEGSAGRVYLLEAAGAAAGGTAYSFALVHWMDPLVLAFVLAAAWCVAGGLTAAPGLSRRAGKCLLGFAACGLILSLAALATRWPANLARQMEAAYWRPLALVSSEDSRYGRVAVVKQSEASPQRSLYQNGTLAFSYPDPPRAEAVTHLPLLEHPEPRRVLLLGGGLGGALVEVLKHPSVEHVMYLELDPLVVCAVRREFPPEAAQVLSDPRVQVVLADGRAFLKRTPGRYDVIIAAEPPPTTAQANRFYTQEFFREAAGALEPGGVFAFQAPGGVNYIPEATQHLIACLHHTLAAVFPSVLVFPGAECAFLASNRDGVLTYRLDVLGARMQERGLRTSYVDTSVWESQLLSGMEELHRALLADEALNRDLAPRSYYYEAQRWSALQRARGPSRFDLGRLLVYLEQKPAAAPLALLALVAAISLAPQLLRRDRRDGALAFAVASTGLVEMAVEFVVLLGFQVVYGYVYQYVGVLVASFMLGLTLGAWASNRWVERGRAAWGRMQAVQAGICVYPLAIFGLMVLSHRGALAAAPALTGVLFGVAAFGAGVAGGLQFPLALALHSGRSGSAGGLYGLDLFGSCFGAIAVSSVLVPTFGLSGVCIMLSALGALALLGVVWASQGGIKGA